MKDWKNCNLSMRKMKMMLALVTVLLVASQLPAGLTSPSTAPAFLWSRHQDGFMSREVEAINYRTLFSKDLAQSVMSEGGWSNLLCTGKESRQPLDFALLFVGKELRSMDISTTKNADPVLVDLLKVYFGNSNFSLAFPYVAALEENKAIESSLISEFEDTCGSGLGFNNIAFMDSCSLEGERFEKLADIPAVQNYLISKMEQKSTGQANLIVVCHGGSQSELESDLPLSEAQLLSQLISSVEHLNAKYTVLFVSDPNGSIQYRSHRDLTRFLAEETNGSKTICDEVCQIKSSLLEGLFVAIVLLIILISGLCCMAGIDTPTRFEGPQDS